MKKGLIGLMAVAVLLLAGCCSFDPTQAKAALQLLQSGYDTTLGFLDDPATKAVDAQTLATLKTAQAAAQIAVPLMDGALDQLGKVLAAKCPAPAAVTAAVVSAQLAAQAQAAVPVVANPTLNP